MNYENIKKSLQRVLSLIEEAENSGISAIEYDLILRELQDAYSAIRFNYSPSNTVSEADPTNISAEQPAVPETATTETGDATTAETAPKEETPSFKTDETAQNRRKLMVRSLYSSLLGESQQAVSAKPDHTEADIAETPILSEEIQVTETAVETETPTDAAEPENISVPEKQPASLEEYETQNAEEHTAAPKSSDNHNSPDDESESDADNEAKEPADEENSTENAENATAEEPETTAEPEENGISESESAEKDNSNDALQQPYEHHSPENAETVLGEIINSYVKTFADTIAPPENAAADIAGKSHIDKIGDAVGINDRFLLIRDLFGGDATAYETAVTKLDSFDNLDDCMLHIVENYDWNPYSDGAKLLMALIERRYGAKE